MPATHFFYGDTNPPRPNKPLAVGITALIRHPFDGRFLLERRSDNGRWSTLGGGVDPHEHPEDAVIREVNEETGLTVVQHRLVGVMADRSMVVAYPDGNIISQVCLAYLVDVAAPAEPRLSSEALELRWMTLPDSLRLDLVTSARFQLERLAAGTLPFVG